jgi:hypothetical protein
MKEKRTVGRHPVNPINPVKKSLSVFHPWLKNLLISAPNPVHPVNPVKSSVPVFPNLCIAVKSSGFLSASLRELCSGVRGKRRSTNLICIRPVNCVNYLPTAKGRRPHPPPDATYP